MSVTIHLEVEATLSLGVDEFWPDGDAPPVEEITKEKIIEVLRQDLTLSERQPLDAERVLKFLDGWDYRVSVSVLKPQQKKQEP